MNRFCSAVMLMSAVACGDDGADEASFASCQAGRNTLVSVGAKNGCAVTTGRYTNGTIDLRMTTDLAMNQVTIGFDVSVAPGELGSFEIDSIAVRDSRDTIGGDYTAKVHIKGEVTEIDGVITLNATFRGTTYYHFYEDVAETEETLSGTWKDVVLDGLPPSTNVSQCHVASASPDLNAAVLFDGATTAYCAALTPTWVGSSLTVTGDFVFGPAALGYEGIEIAATANASQRPGFLEIEVTVDTPDGPCTGPGIWQMAAISYPPTGEGTGNIGAGGIEADLGPPCSVGVGAEIQAMSVTVTRE